MLSTLYVIIVETGEYSDRTDWIGGVFDNKEAAQSLLLSKAAEARQRRVDYETWCKKRRQICERVAGDSGYWKFWELSAEVKASIDAEAGESPKGQDGDRFYLVEVPFNKWGEFPYTGDEVSMTRSYDK